MSSKIEWMDFGKPAFEKSAKDGKPVLLSITAPWSGLSREMEEQTYNREKIIKNINEDFVPVKVSSDERPDINLRYGQNGWPSTVFLTQRGAIITGCTYVSESELADLLEQVSGIYESLKRSGRVGLLPGDAKPPVSFEEKRLYFIRFHTAFVSQFEQLLAASFDPVYGGFSLEGPASTSISSLGGAKFPWPDALDFCLQKYKAGKDQKVRIILEKTLEGMAEGGLFDHLEGGFFRGCEDRKWHLPQFEKLLTDNINLARVYLEAGKVLRDPRFTEVYEKTTRFINLWLSSPETGEFYSSVSADADYYKFASRAERLLYLEEHKSPRADKTVYANKNGLAAGFYLEFKRKEFLASAFSHLLNSFRSPDGLFFHYKTGETGHFSDYFADQLSLVKVLIDPVLNSSDSAVDLKPKVLAADLWGKVMDTFYDRENGGFIDRRMTGDEIGLLKFPRKILKDNVEAVRVLRHFGQMEEARRTLVELLWQNKTAQLGSGPLAAILLENI